MKNAGHHFHVYPQGLCYYKYAMWVGSFPTKKCLVIMLTDINNKLSMDSNYSLTVTPVDFNTPAIDQ